MIEKFENWFQNLSDNEKKTLLRHIMKKYLDLSEGYHSGPITFQKGLYSGPISSQNQNVCPTCNRPY